MALTVQQRTQVWRVLMRHWSANNAPTPGVTKFDLYNPTTDTGAIVSADLWLDTNQGATTSGPGYNSALPAAVRTNLTSGQKALILTAVTLMRYDVALLRRALGEVS